MGIYYHGILQARADVLTLRLYFMNIRTDGSNKGCQEAKEDRY